MSGKLRVGLIFGGRSVEHEVSLVSARSILKNLDPARYEVVPIRVNREGKWETSGDPGRLLESGSEPEGIRRCLLAGDPTAGGLLVSRGTGSEPDPTPLDVVFPIIHGNHGEDGTLQGLLELAGVPYVGAGVLASAVGMDKEVMKRVFRDADLPVARSRRLLRREWEENRREREAEISGDLGFPCFVKPANTGSSVGISKVRQSSELEAAVELAFRYDRKVVVEEGIDAREIECSVLGNDDPRASIPGEVVPGREFYDYEAKYLVEGSELLIPAPISAADAEEVRRIAVAAFRAIDGAGMARVDFFLDRRSGRLLLNEVNTLPGFTPISMYPKLWEASGIPYPRLLDRLIELALERHRDRERSATDYRPRDPAPDP